MKKALFISLALFVCAAPAMAKKKEKPSGKPAAFNKGSVSIGLAAGFGLVDGYDYNDNATVLPAFSISYDQGFFENIGPGTIGIGAMVGYASATYKYSDGYKATWANYIVGVRGTYHLTILKDKTVKFDPYAGIMAGVRVDQYSNTYDDYFHYNYTANAPYPVVGVFIGAKYNFTKALGVYAEAGYDISLVRVGLTFNFGGPKMAHMEGDGSPGGPEKIDNATDDEDKAKEDDDSKPVKKSKKKTTDEDDE